jgi:DNA primase
MADLAQSVKDSVTMPDVIAAYLPDVHPEHHRIPCPFHNGKDRNLAYTNTRYKCYVCGESGDVIQFVHDLLHLSSMPDAISTINRDFRLGLPIDRAPSRSETEEIKARAARHKATEERAKAWLDEYHAALDEWIKIDKTINNAEPYSAEWVEAMKRKPFVDYKLDTILIQEDEVKSHGDA